MRRFLLLFAGLLAAGTVAACGGEDSAKPQTTALTGNTGVASAPAATSSGSPTAEETPKLQLREQGKLIVGTELPDPPMVIADDYSQIKDQGYEVEMINEMAKRLGGLPVEWIHHPFDAAIAGSPWKCDLYVDGVTIYDDRKEKVDFSSGYFKSNQAALVKKGIKLASLDDARKLQWIVTRDSSGQFYMDTTIKPEKKPLVVKDPTAANLSLRAGHADAVITDVAIAEDLAKKNSEAEIAGQFETGEDYGIVLPKDSPNTAAVTALVDQLRGDGFFDTLYQKYFPTQSTIPVIR
jgi:polar amino acid transport system substrate-binding protein